MSSEVRTRGPAPVTRGPDPARGWFPGSGRGASPFSTKLIAVGVIVILGMRVNLPQGLTLGYVACAVLVPLWFPVLKQFWGARVLLAAGALALMSGLWLTEAARATHDVSLGQAASASIGLFGLLVGVGFMLWARTVLPDAYLAIWFSTGLLLGVSGTSLLYQANPWRFGFSVAITIALLGIAMQVGKRWLELAVVLAFTLVATMTDARSTFAILLITALLVAWQMRPSRPTRSKSALRVIVALGLLALAVYNVGQALIIDGAFGQATQERTMAQVNTSGSLILGGRPEMAATVALMQHNPWGFGAGTQANEDDILAAKTALADIGYQPDNGYVEKYMFGSKIEVHSVIGDLWAAFGIPGLLLAGVILFLVLRGVGTRVAAKGASALVIYLAVKAVWALLFGPMLSSTGILILALGLLVVRREQLQWPTRHPLAWPTRSASSASSARSARVGR